MVESENRAHLFQLKTEPQFYPGLHFIGEVTLPSAQDSVSICSATPTVTFFLAMMNTKLHVTPF